MTRAWFSQVQVDASRSRVELIALDGDILVAVTSAGVVHAMDSETGQTRWVARIGNPTHPSLGPGIDATHVALVNGSTLFVLDREDGSVMMERRLGGGVGGGPALSSGYAFVPLLRGRVEGYQLDKPKRTPWFYNCRGRIFQPAVATRRSVIWSNDQRQLFVADGSADGVRFRFETGTPIDAPPTAESPRVYAGSVGGYVYALDEETGLQRWRYAAGFAVRESPVVIGETLIVATEEPALHAIDAATGSRRWTTGGVTRFVSASESRVYALSKLGDLLVLDRKTGGIQARAVNRGVNAAVLNVQTDRLYLYASDGLVQCLREQGAETPYYHRPPNAGDPPAADGSDGEAGDGEAGPAAGAEADTPQPQAPPPDGPAPGGNPFADPAADPFGGAENPFGGAENPFGGGSEAGGDAPAGEPAGTDPFGGDPFGAGGDGEDPFAEPVEDPFG